MKTTQTTQATLVAKYPVVANKVGELTDRELCLRARRQVATTIPLAPLVEEVMRRQMATLGQVRPGWWKVAVREARAFQKALNQAVKMTA